MCFEYDDMIKTLTLRGSRMNDDQPFAVEVVIGDDDNV